MGYYPIVSKKQTQMEGLGHRALPKAYMEDFSILGFRVADCERAQSILKKASFELQQGRDGLQVKIENPARVKDVIRLLGANGLACEVADVAQGMYQG